MSDNRILVVDDEKLVCWSLSEMLTGAGFTVETALTGAEARDSFNRFNPEIILLDVRLPDANGLELLSEFKALDEDIIILMITAYADADSAVNALKKGADDYIGKPFDLQHVRHVIEQAFEKKRLNRVVNSYSRELRKQYDYDNLIGNSSKIIEVFKLINVCAETDAKIVLILGESGTGKELVARAIHHHSARSKDPFIETNCAAIPDNLMENELFGHEKGAFTDAGQRYKGIFEAAEGGTVFFDEIGDMALTMQAKILKVIDSNAYRRLGGHENLETNVRIITATNRNLKEMVKQESFRNDLFYRLNVMTINLPPLRDRKEDIPSLAAYFIERIGAEYGRKIAGLTPEALECLMHYNWPGNVRELRNSLERAMMLEDGTMLTPQYLSKEIRECVIADLERDEQTRNNKAALFSGSYINLPPDGISLTDVEEELIRQAMARFKGNQTRAAKCLHMSRDTLRYRLKKFGII
ncbi:MAG: sigma-54 dependent transcriptional regulator [Desulfocapsa sp.]|nr:sigma-54 dependent transcriptional regulator [Desulfocapsa sp.]